MKKYIISIIMLAAVSFSAASQDMGTSYFLDNNLYSYRINPAIAGEKGFVGFALSNININLASNTGVGNYLFPKDGGGLVTALHSSVSADQFLGQLKPTVKLEQTLNMNLLAVGFWTKKKHFHNIEINVKENIYSGLPSDLFAMMKIGSSDTPYNLSSTRVAAKAYVELAYGYTQAIGDKFTVGGRAKLLVGMTSAQAYANEAYVTVNGDRVKIASDFRVNACSNFVGIGEKQGAGVTLLDFSAFSVNYNTKPSGFGGAVDLGMTYKPVKGLNISFSVLDLGGIGWKYDITGQAKAEATYEGITIKSDGTVSNDYEQFLENLVKLTDFESKDGVEKSFEMLPCTLNLGARYNMPFYERFSVGALVSYKISKYNPLIGGRLGLTVTPLDWLSLTGNLGINNYCGSYGAALSLNLVNLNFLFGYEGYMGKWAKIGLSENGKPLPMPVTSFQNVIKLGVNITFGKRHCSFQKISDLFIHGKRAE